MAVLNDAPLLHVKHTQGIDMVVVGLRVQPISLVLKSENEANRG